MSEDVLQTVFRTDWAILVALGNASCGVNGLIVKFESKEMAETAIKRITEQFNSQLIIAKALF